MYMWDVMDTHIVKVYSELNVVAYRNMKAHTAHPE